MAVRNRADVTEGEQFGPVTVPIDRAGLVAYANASGDQNPIHQDNDYATKVGLPGVIAHGMWTLGASSSVVAQWAGDAGRVLELGTRFTAMVPVPEEGTELEVTGVVRSVDAETGRATVDVTTTNAGQQVLGRCSAVVQLD
jgi:acyl dehydratase